MASLICQVFYTLNYKVIKYAAMNNFPKYLERKYLEWQQQKGERKTIEEFAAYLGVSQGIVSFWMNGRRKPNQLSVEMLAGVFGLEVYDALDLPRPDADLHFIQSQWENLTPEERHIIRQQAERYAQKQAHKKPRTLAG